MEMDSEISAMRVGVNEKNWENILFMSLFK